MFDFTPRVREAIALHERYELHAGIDISDGLALDVSRLADGKRLRRCDFDRPRADFARMRTAC